MADRLRILWVGAGLLLLVFVPTYLFTLTPGQGIPRDGTSLVVGRDFLNIWMYGRAAWEAGPERYYDMETYLATLGPIVGEGYPGQLWSYPPVAMLVAAPFGLLPYLPALALWTLCGAFCFVHRSGYGCATVGQSPLPAPVSTGCGYGGIAGARSRPDRDRALFGAA